MPLVMLWPLPCCACVALPPPILLIRGALQVNGLELTDGDAALLTGDAHLELAQAEDAEVLVFDLAA